MRFDLAKKMQPDCIILDVMMEHSSEGLEVAQKLLNEKKTADIPVILVTGIRKPQNLAASFAGDETWTNVRGTIEKPVKPEELLQVLAKILSSK
jgi:CheY-like chemotaxis protein